MNFAFRIKLPVTVAGLVAMLFAAPALADDALTADFQRLPGDRLAATVTAKIDPARTTPSSSSFASRAGAQLRATLAEDPVTESFIRMLAYATQASAPRVPAGTEVDPLIAAMVEPLRRWLSESAASQRLPRDPAGIPTPAEPHR